jgi:hypothetical protein
MSSYQRFFSPELLNDLKKIKSNFELQKRLEKKIQEILKTPYH